MNEGKAMKDIEYASLYKADNLDYDEFAVWYAHEAPDESEMTMVDMAYTAWQRGRLTLSQQTTADLARYKAEIKRIALAHASDYPEIEAANTETHLWAIEGSLQGLTAACSDLHAVIDKYKALAIEATTI